MKHALRTAALRMMRVSIMRRAALAIAARRERALILVYHRVLPDSAVLRSSVGNIVPTVSTAMLREHMEALAGVGDFVSLPDLVQSLDSRSGVKSRRIRLAVTFDDDEPSHLHHALPVLQSLGIPATFFLCGRALHGLGPHGGFGWRHRSRASGLRKRQPVWAFAPDQRPIWHRSAKGQR